MMLGPYEFKISAAAYEAFSQVTDYRWAMADRIGRAPAAQFVGLGKDEITIDGTVYPHFAGGLGQINIMRAVAAKGQPLLLVDGLGFVRGDYAITRIQEKQTHFEKSGVPKKQEFTITLMAYGNDTSPSKGGNNAV
jgi:phage protein U